MLRSPDIISEHYDGRTGLYCRHTRTSADIAKAFGLPDTLWGVSAVDSYYGMATGATKAEAVAKWFAANPVRIAA